MDHSLHKMHDSHMGHHGEMHSGMNHSGHVGHHGHGAIHSGINHVGRVGHDTMVSGMDHAGHVGHNDVIDSDMDHSGHVMSNGHDMAGKSMNHMHMRMNMHAMHITPITMSDFLIEGLRISSISGLVVAMLSVMLLTILFEGLNFWHHLKTRHQQNKNKAATTRLCQLTKEVVWKLFTVTIGYIIMLSVMTMNAWLLASAIIGSGLGHLFMRPLLTWKMTGTNEKNLETISPRNHDEILRLKSDNNDLPELTSEHEKSRKDCGAHEHLLESNLNNV